jgi:hypothetical protein
MFRNVLDSGCAQVPSPHELNRAIAREGLFGRGTEARKTAVLDRFYLYLIFQLYLHFHIEAE